MNNFIYPYTHTYNCMLMRMKEAGEYSGLHPHTLRKYIDNGLLKGVRIGKHRFIDTRIYGKRGVKRIVKRVREETSHAS